MATKTSRRNEMKWPIPYWEYPSIPGGDDENRGGRENGVLYPKSDPKPF